MDFLTIIHIIIAIILILLVLVQDSKGAMGSTFGGGGGGGSNTLFGATGVENVLTRSTKIIVIFFALTCILLTRLSSQNRDSVLDTEGHRPTQPVNTEQPIALPPTDTNPTDREDLEGDQINQAITDDKKNQSVTKDPINQGDKQTNEIEKTQDTTNKKEDNTK